MTRKLEALRNKATSLSIALLAAACSSSATEPIGDGGSRDASAADASAADAQASDAAAGDGGMNDSGPPPEFCMASTPQSNLHEGRCRNDDGTIDQTATNACLLDRDYMDFF